MTDSNKKTLSLSLPSGVSKTQSTNRIRQSFSHGKSKVVAVEIKKKRFVGNRSQTNSEVSKIYPNGDLTNSEVEKRLEVVKKAIEDNKAREIEKAKLLEQQRLQEEIEKEQKEETSSLMEETVISAAETPSSDNVVQELRTDKVVDSKKSEQKSHYTKSANVEIQSRFKKKKEFDDDNIVVQNTSKRTLSVKHDIKELRGKYSGNNSRISIYNALDNEDEIKERSLSSIRRAQKKNKQVKSKEDAPQVVREVIIPDTISVQELANRMAARSGDVIKTLMKLGVMATINQVIDSDTAELVALEFGHKVKHDRDSDIELGLKKDDLESDMLPRPPVVTIMGHVDHGKTSLLDALRKTDVALKEAGGITQGIGAYQVSMHDGRRITFIDTPGHAAFTEMRSRGANVTDVVILVVAADDSVKDQTVEAIHHAKAAGVPIIVAINKMDKPGANANKTRENLLNHDIVVEEYGGDVIDVEISAKTGMNLDKLEEAILLQADVLGLKANPNRNAEGVVIESRIEKGLGAVATILINKGTLHIGDYFVSGVVHGRVRAIRNDMGENLQALTPGMPGKIIGFDGATIPGDDFIAVESEARAKEIANYRDHKKREQEWVVSSKKTIDEMFSQAEGSSDLRILSLIIKTDVQGSAEAICSSLQKLSTNEVAVKVIHSGIGEITENDVALARASNAMIIGFNVRSNAQARDQMSRDHIEVRYYSVIYDLIDAVKSLLSGLLKPEIKEKIIGNAEVRKTFDISKIGRIAGCIVSSGIVRRGAKARLMRDGVVVYTGDIKSVHKGKDDVKEAREGFECGILIENYNDVHVHDVIECFELEEIARKL